MRMAADLGKLKFVVRYSSGEKPFEGLDHYSGSLSLFGIFQALLISLNAFFNREIITQAPSAKGFRVVMGRARTGSFEQLLTLVITDPAVMDVARDLGKNALYDLLKWALVGGLGIPFVLARRKSRKRVRELERENDDLHEKLDEALRRAHAPVKNQGLKVEVQSGNVNLATFDQYTLQFLETEVESDDTEQVECAISRFNTRTGTGRLIKSMDAVSVPFFPFHPPLDKIQTTRLADNLAKLARGQFEPISVVVSRVTDGGGNLKRYKLHRALKK
jgi:hypothetical protein